MAFIEINKHEKVTHIHVQHKYILRAVIVIITVLLIASGISGYLYYNYVQNIDSSSTIQELLDFSPPQPPADIKHAIQKLDQQTRMLFRTKYISLAPTQQTEQTTNSAIPLNIPVTPKPTTAPAPTIASISATIRIPILMYHYVEYVQDKNDKTRISLNTTPYTLEEQIKTLIAANYTFITNNELSDVLDGKANLPPNPILLTFDDGYRDFYTDAYPILKKYHVKATQYVIYGFLGMQNHMDPYMVKEIAKDGLVEIGSHTIHHVWLKGLTLQQASPEIFQSRVLLEQLINQPVHSFAYPFGAFDDQAIRITRDAGYRSAVSTLPGVEQNQGNRFFMFRLRPGGRLGQNLLTWLKQAVFYPY